MGFGGTGTAEDFPNKMLSFVMKIEMLTFPKALLFLLLQL